MNPGDLGANSQWIPGGQTSGGISEATVDQILPGAYEVKPINTRRYIMNKIYEDYGIEILRDDEKYFLRYDAGEIVVQLKDIEISEVEAREIQQQKSEKELYDYMIKNLNDRICF